MDKEGIKIFTDGSSKGNPGPGGWGAVILSSDSVFEIGDKEEDTTNNRMELRAILESLRKTSNQNKTVTIYTDSKYAMNGATKWVNGWKKNGWLTKEKKEVLNRDLWEEIDRVMKDQSIKWEVIGGHIGIPGNERADVIASDFASGNPPELFEGDLSDYKIDITNIDLDAEQKQKKSEKSARAKIKAYSYLSLVNGKFTKHKSWNDCEACVSGLSGVKYRKSISEDDEKEIMKDWGVEEKE